MLKRIVDFAVESRLAILVVAAGVFLWMIRMKELMPALKRSGESRP